MTTNRNNYSSTWPGIEEEELQAYVDGELSPDRRTSVEAYLAANPNEAERIRGYQAQRIALQALAAPVVGEPLPENLDKLRQDLVAALGAAQRRRRFWRWGSAAAAAVSAIAVAGWFALGGNGPGRPDLMAMFSEQATRAQALYGAAPPNASAKASSDMFGWFARRVIQSPASAPDLRPFGFTLIGSQVIPTPDRPNIQLIYGNEQKTNVTFVMSAVQESEPSDFRYTQEGELSAWYWSRDGLQFGLVGQMPRERLLELARTVDTQMSEPRDGRRDRSEAASSLPVAPPRGVVTKEGAMAPVRSASSKENAPVVPATHNPPVRMPPVGR